MYKDGDINMLKNRGFASMPEAKRIEIARKGGRASHEKGTAHEFTSEEAKRAGKKGGKSRAQKQRMMRGTLSTVLTT